MSGKNAQAAVEYASSPAFLKLYSGFLIAYVLAYLGSLLQGVAPIPALNRFVTMVFLLAAGLVMIVTFVAILHKVLTESVT